MYSVRGMICARFNCWMETIQISKKLINFVHAVSSNTKYIVWIYEPQKGVKRQINWDMVVQNLFQEQFQVSNFIFCHSAFLEDYFC